MFLKTCGNQSSGALILNFEELYPMMIISVAKRRSFKILFSILLMFWQQHIQSVEESPWSTESHPTLTQRNTAEKQKTLKKYFSWFFTELSSHFYWENNYWYLYCKNLSTDKFITKTKSLKRGKLGHWHWSLIWQFENFLWEKKQQQCGLNFLLLKLSDWLIVAAVSSLS